MNRTPSLHAAAVLMALLTLLPGGAVSAQDETPDAPDQSAPAKKATDANKTPAAPRRRGKRPTAAKPKASPEKIAPTLALTNGRIHTLTSQGVLESATILIAGDRITAIGTDVKIPDGVRTIDVAGMTVAPGLIDCRSSLWLARDSVSASSSSASLKAVDGVDMFADDWIEVARQGVTTVSVQPSGSMGGQTAVLRVAPASSLKDLLVTENGAIQASLGLSGKTGNSRDRYLQYEALKKTLDGARAYKEQWKKYREALKKSKEKKPAADAGKSDKAGEEKKEPPKEESKEARRPTPGPSGGRRSMSEAMRAALARRMQMARGGATSSSGSSGEPKKPKKDPIKEMLVRVLDGELTLRIEAHRADDVAHALRLAKDFKLKFVVEGLTQAGRTWEPLQEQHPPIVAGPFAAYESTPSYASSDSQRYESLNKVDGLIAIGSFSRDPRGSRLLRMHAAAAVSGGLALDQALRGITLDAARVLGIDDQTGSIEVGKLADLTVTAGHPLNPAAPVALTISQGQITHEQTDVARVPTVPLADAPTLETLPAEYALESSHVLQPDGTFAARVVHVRDGRIVAVSAERPDGIPVMDLQSAVVSPGLIVGHYAGNSASTTDPVTPEVRAVDGVNPDDTQLRKLALEGFTSVLFSPGSQSVVAGQTGCVRILAKEQVLSKDGNLVLPASKFVLAAGSRSRNRFPAALSGQLTVLHSFLRGETNASNRYLPAAVRERLEAGRNSLLESLKSAATVALVEANSAPEVEAALALAAEYDLRPVLLNPEDLRGSEQALQDTQAALVIRPARISDHDWYARQIAAASTAGAAVSVSGTDAVRLRQTMALLVNAGMSPAAALRSLTSDAADAFQLSQVGRLQAGAVADLTIWNGSPLDPAASLLHVIVDGQLTKDAE